MKWFYSDTEPVGNKNGEGPAVFALELTDETVRVLLGLMKNVRRTRNLVRLFKGVTSCYKLGVGTSLGCWFHCAPDHPDYQNALEEYLSEGIISDIPPGKFGLVPQLNADVTITCRALDVWERGVYFTANYGDAFSMFESREIPYLLLKEVLTGKA